MSSRALPRPYTRSFAVAFLFSPRCDGARTGPSGMSRPFCRLGSATRPASRWVYVAATPAGHRLPPRGPRQHCRSRSVLVLPVIPLVSARPEGGPDHLLVRRTATDWTIWLAVTHDLSSRRVRTSFLEARAATSALPCAVGMGSKPQRVESAQPAAQSVGRLLSVNVGMPKDVSWQGRTVFTGVFKNSVTGRRRIGKLNIEGDGQGDLAGHGGEHRAVFVYQIES